MKSRDLQFAMFFIFELMTYLVFLLIFQNRVYFMYTLSIKLTLRRKKKFEQHEIQLATIRK